MNAGMALHKLICRLVRIVITTIKTKMKPKSSLRKSFTGFVLVELSSAFEIYDYNLDVEWQANGAQFEQP